MNFLDKIKDGEIELSKDQATVDKNMEQLEALVKEVTDVKGENTSNMKVLTEAASYLGPQNLVFIDFLHYCKIIQITCGESISDAYKRNNCDISLTINEAQYEMEIAYIDGDSVKALMTLTVFWMSNTFVITRELLKDRLEALLTVTRKCRPLVADTLAMVLVGFSSAPKDLRGHFAGLKDTAVNLTTSSSVKHRHAAFVNAFTTQHADYPPVFENEMLSAIDILFLTIHGKPHLISLLKDVIFGTSNFPAMQ